MKRRYTLKKAKRQILVANRRINGLAYHVQTLQDKLSEICMVVGKMRGAKKWRTK